MSSAGAPPSSPTPSPGPTRGEPADGGGAATPPEAEPLRRIGPYRLLDEIGRGGQGRVYRAIDERLGRRVALKVLGATAPQALERFRREAEATSRLDHPGVCAVYEIGEAEGRAYIAMRLVDGEPFSKRLAAARRAADEGVATPNLWTPRPAPSGAPPAPPSQREDWERSLAFVESVARALHAAHERGVVHRDVKPGNLMAAPDGSAVVLDFGLAGLADEGLTALTRSGEIFGTPAYMAPEQIAPGRAPPDRRTDVWALGVVLFEALTLRRPFDGATRDALFTAILTEEAPDPRVHVRGLPRDAAVVVAVALEKEPRRRFATALEFAEDLRRIRTHEPVRAQPVGPVGRAARFARRRPAAAALVVALALGLPALAALAAQYVADRPLVAARLLRERAEAVEARLDAAYFASNLGDGSVAERAFADALRIDPYAYEAVVGLALHRIRAQDKAAAERAISELEALPPGPRAEADWLRANALVVAGRGDEARRLAASLTPATTPFGWFVRGLDPLASVPLTESRVFDEDRRRLDAAYRAVLAAPAPRRLYRASLCDAANRVAGGGDPADRRFALACAEAAVAHWPLDPQCRWHEGVAASVAGDWERAARAYARGIELLPADVAPGYGAHFENNFARALVETGRLAEAEAAFERLVRGHPTFELGHVGLVAVKQGRGRVAEAAESLEALVRMRPKDALNFRILGTLRLNRGALDAAVALLRRSLELEPDDAAMRYNLGNALALSGRAEESLREHEEAARLDPGDADILLALARRRLDAGDFAGATAAADAARGAGGAATAGAADLDARAARARETDERLDAIASGDDDCEPDEAVALADAAQRRGRYALAAEILESGGATEAPDGAPAPTLERVRAAVAFGGSAAGAGSDASRADDAARARRRARALRALTEVLRAGAADDDVVARCVLHEARRNSALAPLYEARNLPADEAAAWTSLRDAYDAALAAMR
jgi:serine/threonine protein kinase/Flp pilus assembly protein TadD